ncbi:MAG: formylglycine-generating enzyme family protein [Saprospiraceae bacterium]
MFSDIQNSQTKNKNIQTPEGMVLIPQGPFTMGANGWGAFESPVHEVHIKDFLLDSTTVTNRQFQEFVKATDFITTAEKKGEANGYRKGSLELIAGLNWKTYATPERMEHPVVLVSWEDASKYAEWAKKRLPTEAEFEKASRGGLFGKLYPWGDEPPTDQYCNFAKETTDYPVTVAVKSFPPNAYGLYEICGNVWNWCQDWFLEDFYSKSPLENPKGPEIGFTKVRRGASFNVIQPFRLRCSNRGAYYPNSFAINIGFRCAMDI